MTRIVNLRKEKGESRMIVEPSNQERATWPDATREYVEGIEQHNEALRKQRFEARAINDIKDCPWCDMPPVLKEESVGVFKLSCEQEDCKTQPFTSEPTRLEAILAWNRRNSSLELTADHCNYYEQELIPRLKSKVINTLRLADHWSVSYKLACNDLSGFETLRDLVETHFDVNKIGCECSRVGNCDECIVCLIRAHFVGEKNVEKQN